MTVLKYVWFMFFFTVCQAPFQALGPNLWPWRLPVGSWLFRCVIWLYGLVYRVGKTTDSVMTTDIPIPCNQSFPVFIPELHEGVCKTSLDTAVGFLVVLVGWLGAL